MSFNSANAFQLEEPLLRVPFETARRTFKNTQKIMDHDLEVVSATIGQKVKSNNVNGDKAGVLQEIDSLIDRVQGLKRKMDSLATEQKNNIHTIGVRINHLNELFNAGGTAKSAEITDEKSGKSSETAINVGKDDDDNNNEPKDHDQEETDGKGEGEKNLFNDFNGELDFEEDDDPDYENYMKAPKHLKQKKENLEQLAKNDNFTHVRMTRLLVDHLLKTSKPLTAKALVETSDLADLVDTEILVKAHTVISALTPVDGQLLPPNVNALLTWCLTEAKQFLKKSRSSLEFETRLQIYIELVRQGKLEEAINYYSKWLIKWSDDGVEYYTKLKHCAGLLAFSEAIVHQNKLNQGDMDIDDEPQTGNQANGDYLEVDVPYNDLLSPERYDRLLTSFLHDFYNMYGLFDTASNDDYSTSSTNLSEELTPCFQLGDSAFVKCLSIGISVLKTRSCVLDSNSGEGADDHDSMDEDNDGKNEDGVEEFTKTVRSINDQFTMRVISVPQPTSNSKPKHKRQHQHQQKLQISSLSASLLSSTFCPVCSDDLAPIAKSLPFAHHVHSYVDSDSVVLPNGHIYGRELLLKFANLMRKQTENNATKQREISLDTDHIESEEDDTEKYLWDLLTGERYPYSAMRVVYPS